jgi:hypothetical protein
MVVMIVDILQVLGVVAEGILQVLRVAVGMPQGLGMEVGKALTLTLLGKAPTLKFK